jgi:hypothetical protein
MKHILNRRDFLQISAAGSAICLNTPLLFAFNTPDNRKLISPGCRNSKVKVARLYMGTSHGLWPKPQLNFTEEVRFYESEFAKLKDELADVEFPVDEIVTSPEQVKALKERLLDVDGILAIHLNIGINTILQEILAAGKPTMVFAVPYSGHEWVRFGGIRQQLHGAKMECMLTSDHAQLAVAIRPFRAIHHLREAKIINLTTRSFADYARDVETKFGTEIKQIHLERLLTAYDRISDKDARKETQRWIDEAETVVEPSEAEILKSCKLALALEEVLHEEDATVMTIDCYGSMWDETIKLPAYPCLGFVRLNNMGLGGICESDLRSAMTHIIFQGLSGKPGFISDPTVDESDNSIILAHCLGTTRMDGPDKPAAPYKLRSVMERKEGVVPQVRMRIGERVTQAILVGTDELRYFTGEIIDTPVALADDRGCRTKITVKVDGDVSNLWQNWQSGLHRQTCYGDITRELATLCRFKDIRLINEAA